MVYRRTAQSKSPPHSREISPQRIKKTPPSSRSFDNLQKVANKLNKTSITPPSTMANRRTSPARVANGTSRGKSPQRNVSPQRNNFSPSRNTSQQRNQPILMRSRGSE
jgi:hypothetical protein